jgi:hypothetical protein
VTGDAERTGSPTGPQAGGAEPPAAAGTTRPPPGPAPVFNPTIIVQPPPVAPEKKTAAWKKAVAAIGLTALSVGGTVTGQEIEKSRPPAAPYVSCGGYYKDIADGLDKGLDRTVHKLQTPDLAKRCGTVDEVEADIRDGNPS